MNEGEMAQQQHRLHVKGLAARHKLDVARVDAELRVASVRAAMNWYAVSCETARVAEAAGGSYDVESHIAWVAMLRMDRELRDLRLSTRRHKRRWKAYVKILNSYCDIKEGLK